MTRTANLHESILNWDRLQLTHELPRGDWCRQSRDVVPTHEKPKREFRHGIKSSDVTTSAPVSRNESWRLPFIRSCQDPVF
jgi:hypothetical protein